MPKTDDMLALQVTKEKRHFDELYDTLYNYMKVYMEGNNFDICLFRDEIENYLGIRDHEDIIKYILKWR
jgi:hypothetical protein